MSQSDPATARFLMMQLVRVAGVALAAAGVLLWRTNTFGLSDETTGKALFALGLFASLVAPALLRRRWRTPPAS